MLTSSHSTWCLPLLLIVAGCDERDKGYEYLDAKAGNVVQSITGLSGEWSLVEGKHRSRAEGGACLIVSAGDLGLGEVPCNQNVDPYDEQSTCVVVARGFFSKAAWGYCATDNTCWIKPDPGACNQSPRDRSKQASRWELGSHTAPAAPYEFYKTPKPGGWPKTTHWRVASCVTEPGPDPKKPLLHCDYGEPLEVKI